jgi:hypothetical protein
LVTIESGRIGWEKGNVKLAKDIRFNQDARNILQGLIASKVAKP